MFGLFDQRTTNYLLAGTGIVVTGAFLWKYKSYICSFYKPPLPHNPSSKKNDDSSK